MRPLPLHHDALTPPFPIVLTQAVPPRSVIPVFYLGGSHLNAPTGSKARFTYARIGSAEQFQQGICAPVIKHSLFLFLFLFLFLGITPCLREVTRRLASRRRTHCMHPAHPYIWGSQACMALGGAVAMVPANSVSRTDSDGHGAV